MNEVVLLVPIVVDITGLLLLVKIISFERRSEVE